jgi:pyrroline-5-carboxylate reductase
VKGEVDLKEDVAPSLREATIGMVGTGVMAEAMLAGILRHELLEPGRIVCSHPRGERRTELAARYGVATTPSNREAAEAQIVILGVKPQMLPRVMEEIRTVLDPNHLVLSVIAGASTHALMAGLDHALVVRAMPNTPAQIGDGVTVWYASPGVDAGHKGLARVILRGLGVEIEVSDEDDVAKATAISGTGPTYVFLFIEALIDAGVHLGFPRHVARELVLDTVRGSATFALQSGRHAAELRDMVTSPGGTSAAALYQLESGRLRTVISDAVWAAYNRTRELERRLEPAEDE